jgi:hypothetical protein
MAPRRTNIAIASILRLRAAAGALLSTVTEFKPENGECGPTRQEYRQADQRFGRTVCGGPR